MQSIRIMARFVEHQQVVAQISHDIAGCIFRLKIFLTMIDNTFYCNYSKTFQQAPLCEIHKGKGVGYG
jgi:hypothetical protein